MAVNALLHPLIGMLSHIFVTEMGVVLNDGFQAIIEHNRGGHEVATRLDPFSGPDGTDHMRVEVSTGETIDMLAHFVSEDLAGKRFTDGI